jgi:hypothetical protein
MTKADRVYSTPPTNTSVTRRGALGAIAATIAAVTVAGARPTDAAPAIDPIFAAIAEHQASIQKTDRANDRLAAAGPDGDWRPVHAALVAEMAAARVLIETAPTTHAGLRALEEYLRRNDHVSRGIERTVTTDDGYTYKISGGPEGVDLRELGRLAGATAGAAREW